MDDFDDGGAGLPDEMNTELPDIEIVDAEIEIDIDGVMEPGGRTSGGARAKMPATPRKSSGGARKAAAKKAAPAKKAARPAAKKAAKRAKKAKPAKKAAKKAAKKSPKKAKRKAGQKK